MVLRSDSPLQTSFVFFQLLSTRVAGDFKAHDDLGLAKSGVQCANGSLAFGFKNKVVVSS